jgi:sulfonate transport system permease protein
MFPNIAQIAEAAIELANNGVLLASVLSSLSRVLYGLAVGVAIGVPLGLLSGASHIAEIVFDKPLQMLRAIPFNALTPILIMFFGVGEPMKISLIVIGVFIPVYINTRSGVINFDRKLLEMVRVYKMPKTVIAWHILFKGVLPSILTGLRFALAIAWIALVTCETVNAKSGIGYMLARAQQFARLDQVMVCIILYALLGLLTDFIVRIAESASMRWQTSKLRRGRNRSTVFPFLKTAKEGTEKINIISES